MKPNTFYHICSRAIGSEKLFGNDVDYRSFTQRLKKYLTPAMGIYAHCLIPNHFHLLVRTHDAALNFSKAFSNCLNSYTRWNNTKYNRKGGLFITPFKRFLVLDNAYLTNIICYIHRNPVHHYLCNEMDEWPYSSYNAMLSPAPTLLQRDWVLDWFGGIDAFRICHQEKRDCFFEDYID